MYHLTVFFILWIRPDNKPHLKCNEGLEMLTHLFFDYFFLVKQNTIRLYRAPFWFAYCTCPQSDF